MSIIGGIITILAALAFLALGLLTFWGGWVTVQGEVARGFVSRPASAAGRLLTILAIVVPVGVVTIFAILTAGRILHIVLGLG